MKRTPKWFYPVLIVIVVAVGWKITHKVKLAMTVETDLFSQAQVELNHGNPKGAIELLDTFLKRDPNHVPALQFKLQAEMKLGDLNEAEKTGERIIRLEPSVPNKNLLADIYTRNGKPDQARALLNLPQATPTATPKIENKK